MIAMRAGSGPGLRQVKRLLMKSKQKSKHEEKVYEGEKTALTMRAIGWGDGVK